MLALVKNFMENTAMDMALKKTFEKHWSQYMAGAELPIVFWYENDCAVEPVRTGADHLCFIAQLAAVRNGNTRCFDIESIHCFGGKRYLGFTDTIMDGFEYFLSCGIPGKIEGERYKKSPDLVKKYLENMPPRPAPGNQIVFKRWDRLEEADVPLAVIFFAAPDVLSGLYTLASFDCPEPDPVISPFAPGCGSIIYWPLAEADRERPRPVIGMFDVSARPCVPAGTLSFAVSMNRFTEMVNNIPESFFITPSWEKVKRRIARNTGA
jgi:hypothetical protein